ncbi:MAG: hypothetical protein ABIP94_10550 [Planctomycetota bacterium]
MKNITLFFTTSLLMLAGLTTSCSKEAAAYGAKGTRLGITKPADQTMSQGESNKVKVSIDRTGFAEPVEVTFSNLPQGVSVDANTIPAGDSSRDFVLVASPTAAVTTKQIITVSAKGAGISQSQTFQLTVKARS